MLHFANISSHLSRAASFSSPQFGHTSGRHKKAAPRTAAVKKAEQLESLLGALGSDSAPPDALFRLQKMAGALKASTIRLSRSKTRYQEQAFVDGLTGIPNRRGIDRRMNSKQKKPQAGPTSYVIIDLDHFGEVNKNWGMETGNRVLKYIGRKLREIVRDTDILRRLRPQTSDGDTSASGQSKALPKGKRPLEGRYGGEEFCIILPDTDEKGAAVVVQRLLELIPGMTQNARKKALKRKTMPESTSIASKVFDMAMRRDITASIGAVTLPAGASAAPDTIFGLADYAMRIAKHGLPKVLTDDKREDLLPLLADKDPAISTRNRGFVITGLDPKDPSQWTPEKWTLQFVGKGPEFLASPANPAAKKTLKNKKELLQEQRDQSEPPNSSAV